MPSCGDAQTARAVCVTDAWGRRMVMSEITKGYLIVSIELKRSLLERGFTGDQIRISPYDAAPIPVW
jgi:hypothetical protein